MNEKHRFDTELQPDIMGYMATVGSTMTSLGICPSCLRTNIYGLMRLLAMVRSSLIDASERLTQAANGHPASAYALAMMAHRDIKLADEHAKVATSLVGDMVKLDMVTCLPGAMDLSDEDWAVAIASFCEARMEFYIRDGKLHYEPHESDESEDDEPDDGTVAV